jgi:hypothetical protein
MIQLSTLTKTFGERVLLDGVTWTVEDGIVSVLVVATAVVAWIDHRDIPSLVWPATAAFPLVIGQAVLGGIVVHTDLNPWWVTAHFAVALAFVADVIFVAANAFCAVRLPDKGGEASGGDAGFARLTLFTVGATGALLLVGTYVRARSAGLAFTDWPLMNGRLVPALGGAATAMFAHRVLAAGVFLLVLWVAIRARPMPGKKPRSFMASWSFCFGPVRFCAGHHLSHWNQSDDPSGRRSVALASAGRESHSRPFSCRCRIGNEFLHQGPWSAIDLHQE